MDSLKGYSLEPKIDFEKAKTPLSDTAIMSGGYEIIPKEEMKKRIYERRIKKGENKTAEEEGDLGLDSDRIKIGRHFEELYK